MSDGEILCRCGAMRMLNPGVSCKRGTVIHAVSKCEDVCEGCARLRQEVERLTNRDALVSKLIAAEARVAALEGAMRDIENCTGLSPIAWTQGDMLQAVMSRARRVLKGEK